MKQLNGGQTQVTLVNIFICRMPGSKQEDHTQDTRAIQAAHLEYVVLHYKPRTQLWRLNISLM